MGSNRMTTSDLLRHCHDGDEKSINDLVARHIDWIHSHVARRLGPRLRRKEESLDIVQDAMVRFLKYGPKFTVSDDRHFRALMARIVENVLRDRNDWFLARCRRLSRESPLPRDTVLRFDPPRKSASRPSRAVERHEREGWIRLGIGLLEPGDKEVIVLRLWDRLSWKAVGDRIGVSEEAARTRYRRAMKRLEENIIEVRSGRLRGIDEDDVLPKNP